MDQTSELQHNDFLRAKYLQLQKLYSGWDDLSSVQQAIELLVQFRAERVSEGNPHTEMFQHLEEDEQIHAIARTLEQCLAGIPRYEVTNESSGIAGLVRDRTSLAPLCLDHVTTHMVRVTPGRSDKHLYVCREAGCGLRFTGVRGYFRIAQTGTIDRVFRRACRQDDMAMLLAHVEPGTNRKAWLCSQERCGRAEREPKSD